MNEHTNFLTQEGQIKKFIKNKNTFLIKAFVKEQEEKIEAVQNFQCSSLSEMTLFQIIP